MQKELFKDLDNFSNKETIQNQFENEILFQLKCLEASAVLKEKLYYKQLRG